VSRELSGAVGLIAGLGALAAFGPGTAASLAHALRQGLAAAVGPGVEPLGATRAALVVVGQAAAPVCLSAFAAAFVAGAIQAGGVLSLDAVSPKLDRLAPWTGLRRLFSPAQGMRVAAAVAKTALTLGLAWRSLTSAAASVAQAPRLHPRALLALVARPLFDLALQLAVLGLVFGLLDLLLLRRRVRRSLMMTREEVLRDLREEEGDPQRRAELHRLHRALSSSVPLSRAAVVVVNPTQMAVALGHRRDGDEAPVVLAKGLGDAAGRIRALARRAGVPVVRDVALARALFRLAEVGEEIPEELYQAAAVLLARVYGQGTEGSA
jgi:flagellar biosynthesis protein FlhB